MMKECLCLRTVADSILKRKINLKKKKKQTIKSFFYSKSAFMQKMKFLLERRTRYPDSWRGLRLPLLGG